VGTYSRPTDEGAHQGTAWRPRAVEHGVYYEHSIFNQKNGRNEMTHLYDMDIKFSGTIAGYYMIIAKRIPNAEIGDTVATIDIHQRGVNISSTDFGDLNPRALALIETYRDAIRTEMEGVLSLTDEEFAQWIGLVDEYKEYGMANPLMAAYDEVKRMIKKQSQPDMDKDRDVM
jgi:hypothetical protein